jgi:hypothetical protein
VWEGVKDGQEGSSSTCPHASRRGWSVRGRSDLRAGRRRCVWLPAKRARGRGKEKSGPSMEFLRSILPRTGEQRQP